MLREKAYQEFKDYENCRVNALSYLDEADEYYRELSDEDEVKRENLQDNIYSSCSKAAEWSMRSFYCAYINGSSGNMKKALLIFEKAVEKVEIAEIKDDGLIHDCYKGYSIICNLK